MTNNFSFEPDLAAKKIHVSREFNAPIEKVWKAFTDPELLVKWIAPKPFTAEAKIADFTVGGIWLYTMVSPEGQKHWVYAKFTAIENGSAISQTGMFCDGDGNPVADAPKSYRDTKFLSIEDVYKRQPDVRCAISLPGVAMMMFTLFWMPRRCCSYAMPSPPPKTAMDVMPVK